MTSEVNLQNIVLFHCCVLFGCVNIGKLNNLLTNKRPANFQGGNYLRREFLPSFRATIPSGLIGLDKLGIYD